MNQADTPHPTSRQPEHPEPFGGLFGPAPAGAYEDDPQRHEHRRPSKRTVALVAAGGVALLLANAFAIKDLYFSSNGSSGRPDSNVQSVPHRDVLREAVTDWAGVIDYGNACPDGGSAVGPKDPVRVTSDFGDEGEVSIKPNRVYHVATNAGEQTLVCGPIVGNTSFEDVVVDGHQYAVMRLTDHEVQYG